jgi:hypothetical protein
MSSAKAHPGRRPNLAVRFVVAWLIAMLLCVLRQGTVVAKERAPDGRAVASLSADAPAALCDQQPEDHERSKVAQASLGRGDNHKHHPESADDGDRPSTGHAHRFELGMAPGLVYIPGEKAFATGLHLHLVAAIGDSRWGLGLGAERIFDEHGHTTISVVPLFRITDEWSLIVAPGITFPDDDPSDIEPSVHLETAYEFMLGHFHLGPSLEVALDPHAAHVTVGVHMGVGF